MNTVSFEGKKEQFCWKLCCAGILSCWIPNENPTKNKPTSLLCLCSVMLLHLQMTVIKVDYQIHVHK